MALAVGRSARGRKRIMQTQAIVPCVTTSRMRETRAFWIDKLGFELSYDHEHYLGVRGGPKGEPELGFMLPDKEAPASFAGGGLTLCLRVENAERRITRRIRSHAGEFISARQTRELRDRKSVV